MVRQYLLFFAFLCCKIGSDAFPLTEITASTENPAEISTQSIIAHFRNDYVYIDEYDSFYKFHYLKKDFTTAMLTCMEEGAILLIPESGFEISKAINRTSNKDIASLWIGIHNMFHNDVFYTLEGSSLGEDFNLEFDIAEYTRYRQGYYDEKLIKVEKHCVNAYNEYYAESDDDLANEISGIKYQTKRCSDMYQYICKKKAKTIVYNEQCDNYDKAYIRSDATDSCYKLHKLHRNWTEAFKICSIEQAKLVEINNEEEANFLVNQLSKITRNEQTPEFVHVGFSNLIINSFFTTNTGQFLSDAGYEQWARSHSTKTSDPESGDGSSCGAFHIKGGLMTTNCKAKVKFFCEKKAVYKAQ